MKGGTCWRSPSAHGGLAVSAFSRGRGGVSPGGFLVFVCGVDVLVLPVRFSVPALNTCVRWGSKRSPTSFTELGCC